MRSKTALPAASPVQSSAVIDSAAAICFAYPRTSALGAPEVLVYHRRVHEPEPALTASPEAQVSDQSPLTALLGF